MNLKNLRLTNNPICENGYFRSDVNVIYLKSNTGISAKGSTYNENFYNLICICEGKAKLRLPSGKIIFVCEGDIIPVDLKKTVFYTSDQKSPFCVILIYFHPSFIKRIRGEEQLTRIFNSNNEIDIYKLGKFESNEFTEVLFGLEKGIINNKGDVHIESRIQILLAILCGEYDLNNPNEIATIQNYGIKIMEYINHNYCENITSEFLCDKFSISYNSLNRLCKSYSGKTFWNYVINLRLQEVKKLISNKVDIKTAATMCGFSDYNSMFYAYKKHFGHSPSIDKAHFSTPPYSK